jgi:hypothetical protein
VYAEMQFCVCNRSIEDLRNSSCSNTSCARSSSSRACLNSIPSSVHPGYHALTVKCRVPVTWHQKNKNCSHAGRYEQIQSLLIESLLINVHSILSVTLALLLTSLGTYLRLAHQGSIHSLTLTAWAVVYNLMSKQVTVYAEMFVTGSTLIATARGGNSITIFVDFRLFLLHWDFRKRFQA